MTETCENLLENYNEVNKRLNVCNDALINIRDRMISSSKKAAAIEDVYKRMQQNTDGACAKSSKSNSRLIIIIVVAIISIILCFSIGCVIGTLSGGSVMAIFGSESTKKNKKKKKNT